MEIVTCGKREEQAIALTEAAGKDNSAEPESEISVELSSLLPGAFLAVKREKHDQGEIQIEVTGPKAIQTLSYVVTFGEIPLQTSHYSDGIRKKGDRYTADVSVSYDSFESAMKDKPWKLVVRKPVDVKRERFRFVLDELGAI